MKNIIVTALFLFLSTNTFACYDESLSGQDNFDNCLVEAEKGRAVAQYNLGVAYDNGKGVAQDYKKAVKWYTKAAKQGVAIAQYNLGLMHNNARGVAQDYEEAVTWWRKAAEQGYAEAQFNLGHKYKGAVKA